MTTVRSRLACLTLALLAPFVSDAQTSPDDRRGSDCGQSALTRGDLPDPFVVDPNDAIAILAFMDRVSPFASAGTRHALRDGIVRFWRLYRPDLKTDEFGPRVIEHQKSMYGLMTIRRSNASARVEKGRLRLTWLNFLRDVAGPGDTLPDDASAERARILTIAARAPGIFGYLDRRSRFGVERTVEGAWLALAQLYARHLPHVTPPAPPRNAPSEAKTIIAMWTAFTDARHAGEPARRARPAPSHGGRGQERSDPSAERPEFAHRRPNPAAWRAFLTDYERAHRRTIKRTRP